MLLFSAIEAYPRQPSSQSPLRGQYISSFLNASSKRTPRLQPPPYSPQDDLRIRFQTQSNRLHWLRVFIACTTLVLSTACIVCAGRSLHEYSKTQATPNLDPPLWSSGLDVRPAQTVLGCSSLVAVAGLGYLIVAFWPLVGFMPEHLDPVPSQSDLYLYLALHSTPLPPV